MKKEDQLKLKDKMRIIIKIIKDLDNMYVIDLCDADELIRIERIKGDILILMDTICDDYEL